MITAVILTKNEEKNIGIALDSVQFCDKVIVVDDESADNTLKIVKDKGVQILERKLQGNFSDQRNFALSQVTTEWALFIDADEVVSKSLQSEIRSAVERDTMNGYYLKREDVLFGRTIKYGELLHKKFLRLGRVRAGKWNGTVHEVWNIKGNIGILSNPLIHKPHQSVGEFISEIDLYSTFRAKELHEYGVKSSFMSIFFLPFLKFFYLYVVKIGFMDGVPGLMISIMMSFHTFLTRSKLFLLSKHL